MVKGESRAASGEPKVSEQDGQPERLLLLVPTTSYRVGDFLKAADRLGAVVTVGANQKQVLEEYAESRTVTLDFKDIAKGTKQIVAFASAHPLKAIVSTDEETTLLAAKAAAALGLAHNAPHSVEAALNKHRFRTLLEKAHLPCPWFKLFSLNHDPARAAREVSYPCVLKPVALSASRGVIRADDAHAFVAAFQRITRLLNEIEAPPESTVAHDILVEGYIPGIEVALEGLLEAGQLNVLALFDKPDPLEGPFFEETIYVTPSRLPRSAQDEIREATMRAVEALGLCDGPIHAELRLSDEGPVVIELAARSIGGLCARSLRFGAGLSLEELILRHAMGLPIESMEREKSPAGVMMIPIPHAGILREVNGVIDARAVTGAVDVTIMIPTGQRIVPLPEGDRYLGFIFARAETPEAVEACLREAHRRLDFVIEPEP
ncbi:MAG: ATP-grasp domain-containing protein [Proteobacteria bacterium]|nr:ATP-grasp domain-containing protein [Pseudomonadota bacterium]